MLKVLKQFTRMSHKKDSDIENLMIVTLMPDAILFEKWCGLNMINSGEEATRDSIFEFIGIENELLRRGYGDEKGKIDTSKILVFYNVMFPK